MSPLAEQRTLDEIERYLRRDRLFTLRMTILAMPRRLRRRTALGLAEACCLVMLVTGLVTGFMPVAYLAFALAIDIPTVAILVRRCVTRSHARAR